MALIFTKIAIALVVAAILSLGFFPGNGLRRGVLAIGIVVAAAFVIHFVAPLKNQATNRSGHCCLSQRKL